ncbi:MAG: hypothetical protein IRY99_11985 [Isosphaeraceae bacterium]|nr:hypothetical protein [Isosphaeraceae bacterium]
MKGAGPPPRQERPAGTPPPGQGRRARLKPNRPYDIARRDWRRRETVEELDLLGRPPELLLPQLHNPLDLPRPSGIARAELPQPFQARLDLLRLPAERLRPLLEEPTQRRGGRVGDLPFHHLRTLPEPLLESLELPALLRSPRRYALQPLQLGLDLRLPLREELGHRLVLATQEKTQELLTLGSPRCGPLGQGRRRAPGPQAPEERHQAQDTTDSKHRSNPFSDDGVI